MLHKSLFVFSINRSLDWNVLCFLVQICSYLSIYSAWIVSLIEIYYVSYVSAWTVSLIEIYYFSEVKSIHNLNLLKITFHMYANLMLDLSKLYFEVYTCVFSGLDDGITTQLSLPLSLSMPFIVNPCFTRFCRTSENERVGGAIPSSFRYFKEQNFLLQLTLSDYSPTDFQTFRLLCFFIW